MVKYDFKVGEVYGHVITNYFGRKHNIKDKNVKIIVPQMGRFGSEALSAAFRHCGINSETHSENTPEILKTGRGLTTSKECIPLTLFAGAMVNHHAKNPNPDEIKLMFMASACGPCRLGQYTVYLKDIIYNCLL